MSKKVELSELLGFSPSPELVRMILNDVQTTGKCIEECADKYAMPPMFIVGYGDSFKYRGETMTPEIFKQRFPYRRFVVIRTRQPEPDTNN